MMYIWIRGYPQNWAWSFRTYGSDSIGRSYNNVPPPSQLAVKNRDKILWAFGNEDHFSWLKNVTAQGAVKVFLISNKFRDRDGGIIAIGEISNEDLIGDIEWEYWPMKPENVGAWKYKFFIRIIDTVPRLKEYYEQWVNGERSIYEHDMTIYNWLKEAVLPIIPPSAMQGSKGSVSKDTAKIIEALAFKKWGVIKSYKEDIEEEEKFLLIHLFSGKNLIIFGPPGIGKTTLAKKLLSKVGISYNLQTGNPEWTVFDTIGGKSPITNTFKEGFITESVLKCWKRLDEEGKPHWLILDEINRTNVDLCFGEVFTALDISHRQEVPIVRRTELESIEEKYPFLKKYKDDLKIPFSFRIIGTMNTYDKAMLYKLGYALIRRFALIPYPVNYKNIPFDNEVTEILKAIKNEVSTSEFEKDLKMFKDDILKELTMSNEEWNDYATIMPQLSDYNVLDKILNEMLEDEFSALNTLILIAGYINLTLRKSLNAEAITIGPFVDSVKYVIIAKAYLGDNEWKNKYKLRIIDEAIASYYMPQLDPLAEYIRAEKLNLPTPITGVTNDLEKIKSLIKDIKLINRSLPLIDRILEGERVF